MEDIENIFIKTEPVEAETIEEEAPKKRGRPKKTINRKAIRSP